MRAHIRTAWRARPFIPFLLHFPDGRTVTVPHPEFISVSPVNRAACVWDEHGVGHMIDLTLVSDLEFVPGSAATKPRASRPA